MQLSFKQERQRS